MNAARKIAASVVARGARRLLKCESGTSAVEYALLCGLIVIVMVIGLSGFGTATRATWMTVSNQMQTAVTNSTAS